MKTYFRLLSFAKPIEKFAIPYAIFTIFSVIFNTLNLALLVPLLSTLFGDSSMLKNQAQTPAAKTGGFDPIHQFNHYVDVFVANYGKKGALEFICLTIVISVLLSNLFRYLSQRIIENLRMHTLLNL